jgi:hypothetical protein
MSDKHPDDLPKTQPAFARIPPWPPKQTARDLDDNGKPYTISVSFIEHRLQSGKTESNLPIIDFTFESGRSKRELKTLTLSGTLPLSVMVDYISDGGLLNVMVQQSERVLASVGSRGRGNVYSTFRISNDVDISIFIFRTHKV